MRSSRSTWLFAAAIILTAVLIAATSSFAQFGQNWFDRPDIRKFWNPAVGKGSVYETTHSGGKKTTMEFEIVSKETVDGQTGYWFEMATDDSSSGGKFFAKSLMVPGETRTRRMIFKLPNMDAMEMPMNGNPYAGRGNSKPDVESKVPPKLLGTETITVPAGTFSCEHYQESEGDEAWINPKVSPITLVKRVTKSETMILVKQIDAVEHITGPVKPFDPMAMRNIMQPQH